MSEQAKATGEFRRASPWPVFIALGFALAELGIFVGYFAVAVGGLLLLGGSVAGILVESGYAKRLWRPLAGLGVAFGLLGVGMVASQVDPATLDVLGVVTDPNGIVGRGLAVVGSGAILVAIGIAGSLAE
ncbi:cox cluster protein [Halorhabdus sp. CBA1104]|nr:cox cluster protein [Halorhabdus sp. CBA1104]